MKPGRVGLIAIVLAVAGAVIAGLVVSGSPQEQRLLRQDDQRVNDLLRLSSVIDRHYRETEALPATLETLLNGWITSELPRDPVSASNYVYESTGAKAFRLCANFALASRPERQAEFWSHPAGRACFDFDYTDRVLD